MHTKILGPHLLVKCCTCEHEAGNRHIKGKKFDELNNYRNKLLGTLYNYEENILTNSSISFLHCRLNN